MKRRDSKSEKYTIYPDYYHGLSIPTSRLIYYVRVTDLVLCIKYFFIENSNKICQS